MSEIAYTAVPGHKPLVRGGTSTNIIDMQPPIEVGPAFCDVVLGEDPGGVELRHVFTDTTRTVFLARVAMQSRPIDKVGEIWQELASRIEQLANYPEEAPAMSVEMPFVPMS